MEFTEKIFDQIKPVKGIIFDCDGVLLNSRLANISFYNRLRHRAGFPPMTKQDENYVHMSTYEQALDYILPGVAKPDLVNYLKELDEDNDYYSLLKLEDGILHMLDWLLGTEIKLGICTNRHSPLEPFLQRFSLEKYFNPIQTATNSKPKPSPDGLLKAISTWDMQPEEVAYVGDSLVDEMAANAAKVPFWAFKNEKLAADLHVPSFNLLKKWLKSVYN